MPANPAFAFATVLSNAGNGDTSPIAADYWLGQFLVSNALYKAFVDATGHGGVPKYWSGGTYPAGRGQHPVLQVSAQDAVAYCD